MNMYWRSLFKDIWEGIRSQPGRTMLSFLAITVGSVSLTVLVAVLNGLEIKSQGMVRELGIHVIAVVSDSEDAKDSSASLRESDADLLARNLPDYMVSTLLRYPCLGSDMKPVTVIATDERLADLRQWQVVEGRFLDRRDLEEGELHAVATESFRSAKDLKLGDLVTVRGVSFQLVGSVKTGGSSVDSGTGNPSLELGEQVVFVPKTLSPYWSFPVPEADREVDAIFIRIPESADYAKAVKKTKSLMDSKRGPAFGCSWVTPDSLLANIRKLQRSVRLTAGSVTFLSLVLGGATLMSLMVANVKDRITEIGLRRALGASRMDIALLFVLEACLVTMTAALTGGGMAWAALQLGKGSSDLPLHFGWANVLIPFMAAILLGGLFSYWPASMASSIAPSEALRSE
ncbi:MAG: ABC transporter permease [Lentisphaerota bacterium]